MAVTSSGSMHSFNLYPYVLPRHPERARRGEARRGAACVRACVASIDIDRSISIDGRARRRAFASTHMRVEANARDDARDVTLGFVTLGVHGAFWMKERCASRQIDMRELFLV